MPLLNEGDSERGAGSGSGIGRCTAADGAAADGGAYGGAWAGVGGCSLILSGKNEVNTTRMGL